MTLSWYGLIPEKTPLVSTTGSYTIDGSGDSRDFFIETLDDIKTVDTTYNVKYFETPLLPVGKHQLIVTYHGNSLTAPLTLDYLIIQNSSATSLPSSLSSQPAPFTVTSGVDQNSSTGVPSLSGTMSIVPGGGSSVITPNSASAITSYTLYPTSTSGGGPPIMGSGHAKKLNPTVIAGSISGGIGIVIVVGLAFVLFHRIKKSRPERGEIQNITPTPFQHSTAVDLRFRMDGTKIWWGDKGASMPSENPPQYNIS